MAKKLTDDEVRQALEALPGWTRAGDEIVKAFRFDDFVHAMEFVNRVADEAEAAQHHPDIDIRYNKVTMRLSTHDAGGLTQNDARMAGRINAAETPTL